MKKQIIFFVSIVLLIGAFFVLYSKERQGYQLKNGVNLDIARKFYRPQAIKELIDQIADNKGAYLQLHLSDDENVAIELEILGQTVKNSYLKEGVHYHRETKRPFLTKDELKDLITYANQKKVLLVADFDTPGHFTAAAELLRIKDAKLAEQVLDGDQLAYQTRLGLRFAKELYEELADIFRGQKAMVIGGDEFDGDQQSRNRAYVRYVNTLSHYLSKRGFVSRIWNDTVLKKDLKELDKSHLQIIYWSLNGDANDSSSEWDRQANRYRLKNRATLPELQKAGFEVINANSYYLYSIPSGKHQRQLTKDLGYEEEDMAENWRPSLWNGHTKPTVQAPDNRTHMRQIVGSLYSIWGEEADDFSDSDLIEAYEPVINQFFKQAKTEK